MKRIIIPAGTVSGTKDYILEIPVDPNDQGNNEDSIYILDDKDSKTSLKSLSDYFYDGNAESYGKQLPIQPKPQEYQQSYDYSVPQMYQQPNRYQRYQSSNSNQMLKSNSGEARYPQTYNALSERPEDSMKYRYYKSLGFSDSELQKLSLSNNQAVRHSETSYPRKYIKFNRLGVTDFLSPSAQQYENDVRANPNNFPFNNVNVGTYDNLASDDGSAISNVSYGTDPIPYQAPEYVEKIATEKSAGDRRFNSRRYIPRETEKYIPAARITSPARVNSYTRTTNSYTSPINSMKNLDNVQRYQSRYYPAKPPKLRRDQSPIDERFSNQNINTKSIQKVVGTTNNVHSRQSIDQSKSNETLSYSDAQNNQEDAFSISEDTSYPQEFNVGISKTTFRTLPGTSVVSNPANVKLRKPEVDSMPPSNATSYY